MKIYFEDKDNYLNRLAKAELKIPQYLIDIMQNYTYEKGERKDKLIGIIDYFEGRFVERVFVFKHDNRKKEPLKYQEIIRQAEGLIMKLVRNYYMKSFSYTITWPETKRRSGYYSWYYNQKYTEEWELGYSNYTNSCYKFITTFNYCIVLDPSIKYCGFNYTSKDMVSFIQYISQFRVFPAIEMYSKNGINYLSTDSRFYKKFTKSKEFSKYVRENMAYIKNKKPNYPKILQAYKSGKSIQAYVNARAICESDGYKGNESILTNKIIDKIAALYADTHMYLDYFNAAKHFIYMDTNQALYPSDLKSAHDYYVEKYNEQRDKIKYEAFLKVSKDWEWLNWDNKHFMIMVAPTIISLTNEGQSLHHCVGKMNYDKKMAEGGNLIMFVRKVNQSDVPFYTVEFDKDTKKIVQCHGDHNASATPEINEFLNKWIKKIPQLKKHINIPVIYQQIELAQQG